MKKESLAVLEDTRSDLKKSSDALMHLATRLPHLMGETEAAITHVCNYTQHMVKESIGQIMEFKGWFEGSRRDMTELRNRMSEVMAEVQEMRRLTRRLLINTKQQKLKRRRK